MKFKRWITKIIQYSIYNWTILPLHPITTLLNVETTTWSTMWPLKHTKRQYIAIRLLNTHQNKALLIGIDLKLFWPHFSSFHRLLPSIMLPPYMIDKGPIYRLHVSILCVLMHTSVHILHITHNVLRIVLADYRVYNKGNRLGVSL